MSDEEGFLARWSRRKRAAESDTRDETNAAETPKVETTAPPAAGDESEAGAAEAAVDPASLPPIESIGPESDIREYLKTGVPAELTRAALRRAWSADPAIRDFVGLQENSWDFNAPGGESGFGLLSSEEAKRLFALMTEEPEVAPPAADSSQAGAAEAPAPAADSAAVADQNDAAQIADSRADEPTSSERGQEDVAMQQESEEFVRSRVMVRRGHGGAMPQ